MASCLSLMAEVVEVAGPLGRPLKEHKQTRLPQRHPKTYEQRAPMLAQVAAPAMRALAKGARALDRGGARSRRDAA